MKLHLPKMLRKAVIACMAAVTGISTTVATGTLLVSMMTQQAQASHFTSADGKTETYVGTDNAKIDLSALPDTVETVIFDMSDSGTSNWFTDVTGFNGVLQIGADVNYITQGLIINNGGLNKHNSLLYEISNTITGQGLIKKTGISDNMVYMFTGDTTGFSGKVYLKSDDNHEFTLQFGKAGVTAAKTSATKGLFGDGEIKFAGKYDTLKYAYDKGSSPIYVRNNINKDKKNGESKVEITGGADYVFTRPITIDYFKMEGGSVNFTGGNANLNNTVLNGDVTIGGKVSFAPNYDMTNVKNLTATGAVTVVNQITLMGTVKLSQTVTNKGTIYLYVDDTFSIDLSGLTPTTNGINGKGGTGEYTLFSGGTVAASGAAANGNPELKNLSELFTSDKIASIITGVPTVGKKWSFADGKITYTILAVDLTWSQKDSSFNWQEEGTKFDGDAEFANDDNVIFAEDLGHVTATIDGDIKVSQLTVKAGTDLALAGTGAMEINKAVFEAGSGLTIGAGREMTWAPVAGTEGAPDTLTVNGKLTITDKTFDNTQITVNGGELVSDGRTEFEVGKNIILHNGTISCTGEGVLDFSNAEATVKSGGNSTISAPIRLSNNGGTTTFTVEDGKLTVSEICHKGNGSAGSFAKDGAGTLVVTGNLAHQGTTTVSEGILQFGGTTQADSAVVLGGGSLGVTSTGSATLAELSGAGNITVTEGGVLTLNKVDAGAAGISVKGAVTAGVGFAKTGEGVLTLDVLNVAGAFNMNGWDKLTLTTFNILAGASLVYGEGDVLSIGSVSSEVTLNVFGMKDHLKDGFDTGITLAVGQELQDLKNLLTVNGVDSYDLEVVGDNRRVWLSSTATLESDWDINWGAEVDNAPETVKIGSIASMTHGSDGASLYDLYGIYGKAGYTTVEGVTAISLTGDGNANAIVFGGNDAYTHPNVGTVTTHVWIEANEGTYKAIVGGNYAGNYSDNSNVANFEGHTHIQIDGATVGTIIGGNLRNAKSAGFTGDSYISIFSGNVGGAVVGSSLITDNNASLHKGNTNIFVYTPLPQVESNEYKLYSENPNMVIGGYACAQSYATGEQTIEGNTNIWVDTTKYKGTAKFGKHVIGGNYNFVNSKQTVTGSTNVVMDLGTVEMASGMKIIGGNWCDEGFTKIGATNVTILSGTYDSPIVGGSWLEGENSGTHSIDKTNVTISGGIIKGMVFGGSSVNGNNNTIVTSYSGDITILINGDAQLNSHIYGGHCINSVSWPNKEPVNATIGSVTITLDGADALVAGNIVGGNMSARNHNSGSTVDVVGDVVINLKNGKVGSGVYAAGEAYNDLKQEVTSTRVNLSSTVSLSGTTISGGFCGEATSNCTVTGASTLGFTDAGVYSNIAGTQFKDFNAIELADDANVDMTSFDALNKEVTISGAGTLRMANTSAVALDKLTLSGATVTIDNGIAPTTGLSLHITKPSQLKLPGDTQLTLAALEIDMTEADETKPYVELGGTLAAAGEKLNVKLTNISTLAPGGRYVLVKADSTALTDTDLVYDLNGATPPDGMEYVVEIDGNELIFRNSYLSAWIWEGNTNGEGTVWSQTPDEDAHKGWRADETDGTFSGKKVYFGSTAAGTVTVKGVVTPGAIEISGGEYTFVADATGGSIELTKEADTADTADTEADLTLKIRSSATVNMAMDNLKLGGTTVLEGELVLQSADAIGNSVLKFNGGTLVYEEGITTDLSAQTIADTALIIQVIGIGDKDTVTWGDVDSAKNNSGVQAALTNGFEKTGAGHFILQVASPDSAVAYTGDLLVKGGKLTVKGTESITIAEEADITVDTELMVDSASQKSGSVAVDVAGNLTGAGTLSFGASTAADYRISGDNTQFKGEIQLADTEGKTLFADGMAMGGSDTKVHLNGATFSVEDGTQAVIAQLWVTKDKTSVLAAEDDITFSAAPTGTGTLEMTGAYTATFSGAVDTFEGTFSTAEEATIALGGKDAAALNRNITATLAGDGTYCMDYKDSVEDSVEDSVVLSGVVGGTANLHQSGSGKLILAAKNTTTGTLTVDKGTVVQLGNAATPGVWAGSELAVEGTFILTCGELRGLTTKAEGAKLTVKTTKGAESNSAIGDGGGTIVALSGSAAQLLDRIELAEGSILHVFEDEDKGSTLLIEDEDEDKNKDKRITVGGAGNTTLDMAFTAVNFGGDLGNTIAMIQGCNLHIDGTEGVKFDLENVAKMLTDLKAAGGELYLQVTDGTLTVDEDVNINDVMAPNLLGKGIRAHLTGASKAGGYVIINGDVSDIYFTNDQPGNGESIYANVDVTDSVLETYAATVINKYDTLNVYTSTTINNVDSEEGGDLVITGGASVVLNNQQLKTGVTGNDFRGAKNTLAGDLTGNDDTAITVKGVGGSLTVGGALKADKLTVESGDLYANGSANVKTLTVAKDATMTVGGALTAGTLTVGSVDLIANGSADVADLTVSEGATMTVGGKLTADTLTVESGDLIAKGGANVADLTVSEGATMTVANGMTLKTGSIQGELTADGAGTSLSTTGEVSVGGTLRYMDLTIEDGSMEFLNDAEGKDTTTLNSLQVKKSATLKGNGTTVSVGASQPNIIAGTLRGSGSLEMTGSTESKLIFDNATGSTGWSVTTQGDIEIDSTEGKALQLGQVSFRSPKTLTLRFNSDKHQDNNFNVFDLQNLDLSTAEDGTATAITLSSTGSAQLEDGRYVLGTIENGISFDGLSFQATEVELTQLPLQLVGDAFSRIDVEQSTLVFADKALILNLVKSDANAFEMPNAEKNATAGAELLWNATAPVGGELEDVYNAVNYMIADGDNQAAQEAMAAVAGASTASLGMALAGDVERQLRAIRNRTTTMGVNQCVMNENMPYFNAWVNAEGNHSELDQDSLASGYVLDSWGGTVGFDVDVNPNLTLGLAVTAMYGDLTVDGPDTLEGDMDTCYVTAFARYSKHAWTHTFIGTIGKMDGSYERTVNYGRNSYTAEGDTDGTTFGLMYEVSRTYAFSEDSDACWQPVFNIAYRHTTVKGYTETATDAALDVDDQTLDTVTLSAGARMQAVVGENLFERTSVLELRALAKLDVGDRASEADVALINGTGRGTVESAELGAFGVELGAGLSIPVGNVNDGTIFFDVSAELRSGYSNVNGTVGYRINF